MSQGGLAKPPRGPKKMMSMEDEKEMADYLSECWELGIPKMRGNFAMDVVNYLQCYHRTNNFPNVYPGKIRIVVATTNKDQILAKQRTKDHLMSVFTLYFNAFVSIVHIFINRERMV